jgi:YbbR-like protein
MAVAGLRHIGLKMLSIGLAALLWVLVSGEQLVERALRVPLEFTNVPAQLELVGETPPVVDVRVRGSSGALGRIGPGELVAVLDLRDARPPQKLFHLTPMDVRTPFGVEVVQVSPSSISMRFEQSTFKTVPIVPSVEGEPAPGFVIGTVTAEPATVDLVGARSLLDSVTEAITEPVSVVGKSAPVTESVAVGSPEPAVRLRAPLSTKVLVNVTAAPVEWTVQNVPLQIRNADRPTQVNPRVVTVVVRGPLEARGAHAQDFDASVDVDALRAGQFELPVRVVPPPKVGVVRIEPAQVSVTIR